MTLPMPEGLPVAPLAVLSPTEALLLGVIGHLEAELATFRLPRPPGGWLRVQSVAARLGLRPVTIYRMANGGRIASTKIGPCLWVEPIMVRPPRKRYKRAD
jgi:hypothetical protein